MTDSDDEFADKRPYFEPFNKKASHWGDPQHRPHMANVAYVLSPNLQGVQLKMALLRMQIEESAFKMEHMEEEAAYTIWKECFIDAKSWYNNIPLAVKEKARDVLSREMKASITAFDQNFPSILKRPPPSPSYHKYHKYDPNESQKSSFQANSKDDFSFQISDINEATGQISDNNNSSKDEITIKKKKRNIFDDSDDFIDDK